MTDLVKELETVSPTGLRARAEMIREKNLINDSGSTARHLELAAAALSATKARADKLEAELATLREVANHNYEVSQKHLVRAESAEARAAAMREALESVNKLIEWERRNGTHFALLDHEVEYVSGLWFDARNAVITALKTAGKE